MKQKSVPVSMGSEHSSTVTLKDFRVTDVRFPPGARLEPHVHARATFAVMVEGSFDLMFPSRTYPCTSGIVLTEPAEDRHANLIGRAGARLFVIQPDLDRAELFRPCRNVLDRVGYFRHAGLASLARRGIWEMETPDALSPLALEALALEMLAMAARFGERTVGKPPAWLDRAHELVHERYRENLRIADVSQGVGVHPIRVARAFKAYYGLPLVTYIRRLRLEWAMDRLVSSADSLACIALEAGFSDQSHFTRAFKRHTGRTPREFRESTARSGATANLGAVEPCQVHRA
jgi:AraC family transcriptional regulator